MADNQEEKNWLERFGHQLKTNYRLVVMNDDTYEEVNTYHSNLGRFFLAGGALILTVSFLTSLFFLKTPIVNILTKITSNTHSGTIQLEQKINNLESDLNAERLRTDNIRRILVGDLDTMGTGYSQGALDTGMADTRIQIPRISLDEELRQNLEAEQQENTLINGNNLPRAEVPLGQRFFTPPVSGEVSKSFNMQEKHFGVDIIAPKNTPIKATLGGFVISADWNLETGNTICLQHKGDVITFYKHNSALLKKVGDIVQAGEAIAIIGDTGDHSSGPHLHFELWHKGIPIDARDYVNFN